MRSRYGLSLTDMNAPDNVVAPFVPQIRLYEQWLAQERGLRFPDYQALWAWSVTDLEAFWQSIWDYFDIQSPTPQIGRAHV